MVRGLVFGGGYNGLGSISGVRIHVLLSTHSISITVPAAGASVLPPDSPHRRVSDSDTRAIDFTPEQPRRNKKLSARLD